MEAEGKLLLLAVPPPLGERTARQSRSARAVQAPMAAVRGQWVTIDGGMPGDGWRDKGDSAADDDAAAAATAAAAGWERACGEVLRACGPGGVKGARKVEGCL